MSGTTNDSVITTEEDTGTEVTDAATEVASEDTTTTTTTEASPAERVAALEEELAKLTPLRAEVAGFRHRAKAAEEARDAALTELESLREGVVEARLRAAAVGRFANPEVALRLIDREGFGPDTDDEVYTTAVNSLLEAEPYLAAPVGAGIPASDFGPQSDGAPRNDDDPNAWIRRQAANA